MNNSQIFLYLFIFLFALVTVFKLYLTKRNISFIRKNIKQVPVEFQDVIGQEDHVKAQHYTIEKNKFSQLSLVISSVFTILWLMVGLYYLDSFRKGLNLSELQSGVVLILAFSFIQSLLSIPFTLYSTFVIEEKYGFNKTTPKIFLTDLLKGTILSLVLGVPLIFIVLWIFQSLGSYWWFYTWIFIVLFQIIMVWAYPKFISPLFNKFTPLSDGELAEEIDKLCVRAELNFKDYYVMDASKRSAHGNAYFTGFGKNKRIVFFDTLVEKLTTAETVAVLAHELGHFKKKHIHQSILISFVSLLIGFAILGGLSASDFFYSSFELEKSNAMALLLFMIIIPYYTFFLTPISSWFSRKNEFEADEFAANKANSKDLIQALLKMYRDNSSTLTPDPIYSKFYFSHPPAKERIAFLKRF